MTTYVGELVLVLALHDGDLVAIGVGDRGPVLVVDLLRVLVRDQRRGLLLKERSRGEGKRSKKERPNVSTGALLGSQRLVGWVSKRSLIRTPFLVLNVWRE